jgi:hypothetical protein
VLFLAFSPGFSRLDVALKDLGELTGGEYKDSVFMHSPLGRRQLFPLWALSPIATFRVAPAVPLSVLSAFPCLFSTKN